MKKTFLWFTAFAALIACCAFAYTLGYDNGHLEGYKERGAEMNSTKSVEAKHHYEFKENGAFIYRVDSDTGESCWIQLSKAYENTPMMRCP
jgi:hypothetical protein